MAHRRTPLVATNRGLDPITFAVLRSAVDSILDEMSLTIARTAYSTIVRDSLDFATSLFDKDGQLLAQGLTLPFHLGGMPDALEAVLRRFRSDMHPGDVFILNDPFDGGSHLPDIFMFRPVFSGDELLGFSGTTAHHTDVGGRIPGSNASDSTEIYQEGLRLPAMRLVVQDRIDDALERLIAANVRVETKVLGDLRAQLSACAVGERGLLDLELRFGRSTLTTYFEEVLALTEQMTRNGIRGLKDGIYRYVDFLDDDGIDDTPIRIEVAVRIEGDNLVVDFRGTSGQVRGALNATRSHTKSAVYIVVRSLLDPEMPSNAGFFRPIRIVVPESSVVNLALPGACAARAATSYRVIDALFGALAKAVPERVFAAGDGGNTFVTIAGTAENGRPYIMLDSITAAWGGRSDRDGVDGIGPLAANIRNAPIERVEADYPLQFEEYSYVNDSGGPGRFRGGMAVRRAVRLLGSDALLQVRSDRRTYRPYGLFGGKSGKPSMNTLKAEGRVRTLPSKFTSTFPKGAVFIHVMPSSGGYGDPFRREPEAVLADVLSQKVTPRAAARDYGVVIRVRRGALVLDSSATMRLRQKRRALGTRRLR